MLEVQFPPHLPDNPTKQEMFDYIAYHLFTQGVRSFSLARGCCMYRMEADGQQLKCAVGAIIPDRYYDPDMENLPVDRLNYYFDSVLEYIPQNARFLRHMQIVHDDPMVWGSTSAMQETLQIVAKQEGLDYTYVSTLHFKDR